MTLTMLLTLVGIAGLVAVLGVIVFALYVIGKSMSQ
jgi:hypothetical protein